MTSSENIKRVYEELTTSNDKADINSFWDIINSDGVEMYDHDVVIPRSVVAKVFDM